jgi:hypothetical protein
MGRRPGRQAPLGGLPAFEEAWGRSLGDTASAVYVAAILLAQATVGPRLGRDAT